MNDTDDLSTVIGVIAKELPYAFGDGLLTVANGGSSITAATNTIGSSVTVLAHQSAEDLLDECHMNRFAIDHKVTAAELLKLQEVAPDYASEIKENIAKNLARDISKKVSYTKKHDKDADVHHFIGRVWVFTEDELKVLLGKR